MQCNIMTLTGEPTASSRCAIDSHEAMSTQLERNVVCLAWSYIVFIQFVYLFMHDNMPVLSSCGVVKGSRSCK